MSSQLARFSSFHVPLTKSQQEPSPPVHVDISNIAVLRNALLCFHFFDPFEKGVLDLDNAHRILSNAKNEALVELLKEVLEICRGCLEKKEFVLTLYRAIEAGFCTDLKGKDNVVADYFKGLGGSTERSSIASSRSSVKSTVLVKKSESIRSEMLDNVESSVYSRRASDVAESIPEEDLSDCTFQPKINQYKLKDWKQNDLFNQEVEEILHFKNECKDMGPLTEYIVFHYNSQMDWKSTLRD